MHDIVVPFTSIHTIALILWGCYGLFLATMAMLVWLWRSRRNVESQIAIFARTLGEAAEDSAQERRNGLGLERLDMIRQNCADLKGKPREWWNRIDEKMEPYVSPEDTEGWFLTENPRVALPFEVVVGRSFPAAIFGAYPGLLTAFGLMLTFLAILLALMNVHFNKGNASEPVSGMEQLINGLSGKFLSSIIALVLSILFTITERFSVRRIKESY